MRSASGSPGRVLRDEGEDTRLRLKAAEIIALHGMPKGDAHKRAIESIDSGVSSLKVEFVRADGSTVSFQDAAPPQVIEVPFAEVDESDS